MGSASELLLCSLFLYFRDRVTGAQDMDDVLFSCSFLWFSFLLLKTNVSDQKNFYYSRIHLSYLVGVCRPRCTPVGMIDELWNE